MAPEGSIKGGAAPSRLRRTPASSLALAALIALSLATSAAAATPSAAALQHRSESRDAARLLLESYVFIGSGSGVVIDDEGHILTNHHVTADADAWRIRLASGHSAMADVVGSDPVGDICLLALRREDDEALPPFGHVDLAAAADLRPFRPVLAIGDPFSLGQVDNTPSVSLGVLGAVRVVRGVYTDCLQVDAAVNPGNSGGPLLALDGRLLGINGQIRTRTGMRINSGIGLAISCTQLAAFLPHLRSAEGRFVHHTAIPDGLELERTAQGIAVANYTSDDPAWADLLRPGDLLVRVAGRPAPSLHSAEGCFASLPYSPGCTVPVHLRREGREIAVAIPAGRTPIPGRTWHGLILTRRQVPVEVDGRIRRTARLVVKAVEPASPAARAGIPVDAVVLTINGRTIARRVDLYRALSDKEVGDWITVEAQVDDTSTVYRLYLLPEPQ